MRISVRAIIKHQDRVFLVKHKQKDYFSLPGGRLEENESLKNALSREIYEELGIKAVIGEMIAVHEFAYPGGDISLDFFFAIENAKDFLNVSGGEFADKELDEYGWYNIDNVNTKPDYLPDLVKQKNLNLRYFSQI